MKNRRCGILFAVIALLAACAPETKLDKDPLSIIDSSPSTRKIDVKSMALGGLTPITDPNSDIKLLLGNLDSKINEIKGQDDGSADRVTLGIAMFEAITQLSGKNAEIEGSNVGACYPIDSDVEKLHILSVSDSPDDVLDIAIYVQNGDGQEQKICLNSAIGYQPISVIIAGLAA